MSFHVFGSSFLCGAGVTHTCELALEGGRCSGIRGEEGVRLQCLCMHVDRTFHLILLPPFLLFPSLFLRSRPGQLKEQAQSVVSPGNLPEDPECLTVPKYKRDLVQKLKILRQELSQQQPQAGHCRIEVSREEIFEVRPDPGLFYLQEILFKSLFIKEIILFSKDSLNIKDIYNITKYFYFK